MSDKKPAVKPGKPGLVIEGKPGESDSEAVARAVLTPAVLAGCLLFEYNKSLTDNTTLQAFIGEVQRHADDVRSGNMGRLEEMLVAQAHALDSMFYALINRSRANSAEGYLQAADAYMKLAFRAQSQCRAVAETIGELKNPRSVAFVQQANIANGPQQVNNGAAPRASEIENAPNKLLEASNGERLDTRAASAASATHQDLEAVGTLHRPAHGSGAG